MRSSIRLRTNDDSMRFLTSQLPVTHAKEARSPNMLILTRRVGETVMIGNEVTVTVLGVKGNQVRIGVNAPKDVAVHREEIYERIKREEDNDGRPPGSVAKVVDDA